MKKVDIVFRTVGERTSKIALELAIKNIQPNQVHIIENIKPFSKAVQEMLRIEYDCDFVVFMDADCLIMEDMVPFLQSNTQPYIDCYVLDKFRGKIHCGVHITRLDVVQAMQRIEAPKDERKHILRPESRVRNLALKQLNLGINFAQFHIYHDFFQFYRDIFCKYALRELRSRNSYRQAKFNINIEDWDMEAEDEDFYVAKAAVLHARKSIKENASSQEVANYIEALPNIAIAELSQMNVTEKAAFPCQELDALEAERQVKKTPKSKKMKVFGIGLSRTGTKSLTVALNMLGIHVIHYPNDETTLKELRAGNYDLSILNDWEGIADITVAPFYAQLDKMFPDSKFILTVRDKESWLRSIKRKWDKKPVFEEDTDKDPQMQIRRFLRSAVYGTYTYNEERLSYVYDLHYKNVMEYFKDRPESLLVINICAGENWEKLCPFFNLPLRDEQFPVMNRKSVLSKIQL
mgnify:CR=1 FL=1